MVYSQRSGRLSGARHARADFPVYQVGTPEGGTPSPGRQRRRMAGLQERTRPLQAEQRQKAAPFRNRLRQPQGKAPGRRKAHSGSTGLEDAVPEVQSPGQDLCQPALSRAGGQAAVHRADSGRRLFSRSKGRNGLKINQIEAKNHLTTAGCNITITTSELSISFNKRGCEIDTAMIDTATGNAPDIIMYVGSQFYPTKDALIGFINWMV